MPMTDERRQTYQQLTGLTEAMIEEAIGPFTINEISAKESGLPRDEVVSIRDELRQVMADTIIIGAKYNKVARRTDRNVSHELDQDEIDVDRAFLDEIIADEYRFMNPFGDNEGKKRTIDVIINGRILFENYGHGGYETVQDQLQIHGNQAMYITMVRMNSHAQAKQAGTGTVYEQDLAGTYRNTNSFVRRNGRWRVSACQMTLVPPGRQFNLLCHVGSTVADED